MWKWKCTQSGSTLLKCIVICTNIWIFARAWAQISSSQILEADSTQWYFFSKCRKFLRQNIWSYLFLLTKPWFESMFLDSSVALLISLKNQKIQKTSMTSDINIESRDSQVQQNVSISWFSFEQRLRLWGLKFKYPLPRHSFISGDLSSKMNPGRWCTKCPRKSTIGR